MICMYVIVCMILYWFGFWQIAILQGRIQQGSRPSLDNAQVEILSDSQLPPVAAGDQDGTLVPYSPGSMLNTDVARETLKSVDVHEEAMQKQVCGSCTKKQL